MNKYQLTTSWAKEGLKPSRISKILHVRYKKNYGIKRLFYIIYNRISTMVLWEYNPYARNRK